MSYAPGIDLLRHDDGLFVVSVDGELDLSNSYSLRDAISESLDSEPTALLLDFSELEFMDSTGIGVMTYALARCRDQQVRLLVALSNPMIVRTLQTVGLHISFDIYPNRQRALAALQPVAA